MFCTYCTNLLGQSRPQLVSLFVLLTLTFSQPAFAEQLKVLCAGAFKSVLLSVQPELDKATGHAMVVTSGTAGGLSRLILDGEKFDIVISTRAALKPTLQAGLVDENSITDVAKVGVGVGVKKGADIPPLKTVDDFRSLMLNAKAAAYVDPASGATSGIYIESLFDKLGLPESIKHKAVKIKEGIAAQKVVSGDADVAIQQISEIVNVPGVTFVGPLPEEIQSYTTYVAAIGKNCPDKAACKAFLNELKSARVEKVIREKGMDKP